jgi:Uma2 family endonuclease
MLGMATTTSVPVAEYLSSAYDPDVDFVEGEIEDRNVGEKDHAKLQLRVVRLLDTGQWFVTIETRLRISPTRYRVPDVCVYESEPEEQVFTTAPWIVIEVLSPEDRMSRMQRKMEDYHAIGCPNIWILDPWRRKAYRYDGTSIVEVSLLATTDSRVSLSTSQLF